MSHNHAPPNENLYSRQLYVLGTDTMKRLSESKVLIVGVSGLGLEVLKNVVLAGVSTVYLYDPRLCVESDLSTCYFLTKGCLGQRRDSMVIDKVKELNPYVNVYLIEELEKHYLNNNTSIVNSDLIKYISDNNFTMVVGCNLNTEDIYNLSNLQSFLCFCNTDGLFSRVFVDLKKNFEVKDDNGEPIVEGIFNDITDEGILTVIDGERHNLEDKNVVSIKKDENEDDSILYEIEVINSTSFKLKNYKSGFMMGGLYSQKKVTKKIDFCSFEESIKNPKFLYVGDYERTEAIHKIYQEKDSKIYDMNGFVDVFKEKYGDDFVSRYSSLIKLFYVNMNIEIMPIISVIGGFVAQEVLKGCSGKFTPLNQLMYYESIETLNYMENNTKDWINTYLEYYNTNITNFKVNENDDKRYSNIISIFGRDILNEFMASSVFVVGAGAIGCEHLKNIIMSGIGQNGNVYITDMDSIEQSNLNRQFLFRQKDVGRMKSEIAAREIIKMNQNYVMSNKNNETSRNSSKILKTSEKSSIHSYNLKVGHETENVFSDTFINSLTFIANALDNIEARNYIDQRAVLCRKPLFESGTLGTKGNTQTIIPLKTESYSSTNDPPEKSIPLCTLRNFPNLIEHVIEYALNEFKNSFGDKIVSIKDYCELKNEKNKEKKSKKDRLGSIESIKNENIGEDIVEMIRDIPKDVDGCILNSLKLFYKLFYTNIFKLLRAFPIDHKTKEGLPFWTPPKRSPVCVDFDPNEEIHVLFVKSAANLFKYCFGLKINEISNEDVILKWKNVETSLKNENKNIIDQILSKETQKDDNNEEMEDNDPKKECISEELPDVSHLNYEIFQPVEFEKDDDTNHHIDFIYSCSNIRATNYKIKQASRFVVKGISGRIIPAIATTTALISGLSTMEMYKYIIQKSHINKKIFNGNRKTYIDIGENDWKGNEKMNIEVFKNSFVTLALPFMAQSDPISPDTNEYWFKDDTKIKYNLWDRIEMNDMKLSEFIEYFKREYGVGVEMVICSGKVVYSTFYSQKEFMKNLEKSFKEIGGAESGKRYVVVDVMLNCECENFPVIVIKV